MSKKFRNIIFVSLFLSSLICSLLASVVLLSRNVVYAGESDKDTYIADHKYFDTVFDKSVYQDAVKEDNEIAPLGFDSVWKYDEVHTNVSSSPNGNYLYVHGIKFSNKSLNTVARVRFAMKTNQKMNFNFNKSDESHDWLIFTLAQIGKSKWSLEVENLKGVVIYKSSEDPYTSNGVLNGSYAVGSGYVNNALNAILYGNPKGFGAQAPIGVRLYTYVTEVRAEMKPHSVVGEIIDEALYNSKNIELRHSDEIAPEGYSRVWQYTAAAGTNYIRGDQYSEIVLDKMRTVNFALKTTAGFVIDDYKGGVYDGGDWLYFSLIQTNKAVWSIQIQDADYDIIYAKNGLSGIKNSSVYVNNSLQSILYGVAGYYPLVPDNDAATVTVTEVRATLKQKPFTSDTVIVDDAFLRTSFDVEEDFLTPTGFDSVYKVDFNENYLHGGIHYSNKSLVGYNKISFAIRNDKYINLGSKQLVAKKGWVYFNLSRQNDTKWLIVVQDEQGNVLHSQMDVDGMSRSVSYAQDALSTLLYGNTDAFYPVKSAFGSLYFTEVRGIRIKNLNLDLLDYQVVCPDSSVAGSGKAVRAANEYVKFASEATEKSVSWLRENAFADKGKNFISIGETKLLNKVDFGISETDLLALGDSGYIIKTDDLDNIYIIGGSVENGWMGLMCGVYDLLHEYYGYEYYADGVYSIEKGLNEVKFDIADMDRTVIPSFAYRQRVYGFNSAESNDGEFNGYRLRMNRPYVYGFNGSDMHDLMYAIPYSEYGSAHPNWYMDGYNADGGQPCFTRDPDGIAEVVVEKMIPIVTAAENENAELKGLDKYFYVGMYDSKNWCECSSCTSYINAHGGYKVSTYIYFMNKVAARIRSVGRTDIKPVMLAYHATQDAPVKENSDGTLSLISEDMKLDELVTVYYCPIEANYYVPFNYVGDAARSDAPSVKERNALALKSLKGWGMVAENVMYYFYMEHFPYHYMEFFDIFGSIQENFRVAADNGGTAMYNLGQFNESASTGFARLKEYVNAKLMWNVNENVDELIDGFFANYFGVASVQMRAIFDGQRAMIAEKFKTHPEYGDMSQYAKKQMSSDLFDKEKYVQWIKDFDSAYETVASAYNAGTITQAGKDRLNKAIKLESMSFRAVYIEYFTKDGDTTQNDFGYTAADMKSSWKSDAAELGMTMWAEHETIADHCKNW